MLATLAKWATVAGLILTAIGIVIGFSPPTVTALWSGPEQLAEEHWIQVKFVIGTGCVLVGTILQIPGALPRWARQWLHRRLIGSR
jgi:hypothetical protein